MALSGNHSTFDLWTTDPWEALRMMLPSKVSSASRLCGAAVHTAGPGRWHLRNRGSRGTVPPLHRPQSEGVEALADVTLGARVLLALVASITTIAGPEAASKLCVIIHCTEAQVRCG